MTGASSSTPACGSRPARTSATTTRSRTAPTRYIVLTQSHTDHIGGVDTFREDGTQLIAQSNITACQADDERIHGFRIRRSLPFFADVMGQPGYVRGDDAAIPPLPKPAHADITFDSTYDARMRRPARSS